jgi:hypothetical protein
LTVASCPGAHVGELALLEISLDPHILRRDEREQRTRGVDVIADLQLLDLGDDAILGSADDGVRQIEFGAFQHRARLQHRRVVLDRDAGIAAQICRNRGELLARRIARLARTVERVAQLVHLHLRGNAGGEQPVLPVVFALLIGERVLGAGELRLPLTIGRLQRLHLEARAAQARLRFLHGNAKRRIIDAEQHRTFLDEFVVVHIDLAHPT